MHVDVRGVRLAYEVHGDAGPTVVLVMGLNLPGLWWRDDLVALLVDHGLRVVRFDNRDTGRSSSIDAAPVTLVQFLRRRADPAYTLGDMADDVAGLIAHVAPDGAHVVGASLGAMVAQETAIRHPELVLSLTSIMGRPGDGRTGKVAWRRRLGFFRPQRTSLDAQAEQMVKVFRGMGSTGRTAVDDEDVRDAVRRSAALGAGGPGQFAAVIAERDRTADLGGLRMPVLVVHGDRDQIITPSGGRATAAAVPGAELLMVPGMGHDLPRRLWPELVDAVVRTVERSSTREDRT